MQSVEVVINLATSKLNTSYTYAVPEKMASAATFGKRALVEFGGRRTEGFIITEPRDDAIGELNPLLKVVDSEAVFDRSLLALAQWMSDFYLCPLAMALNIMVPRVLQQPKVVSLLPAIEFQEYERLKMIGINLNEQLFAELWRNGELNIAEALRYASRGELSAYEKNGYLISSGEYRPGRRDLTGLVYCPGQFDPKADLQHLERRAPRQAQIMQRLLQAGRLDQKTMRDFAAPASLKALLKKGFIEMRPATEPLMTSEPDLTEEQKLAIRQVETALQAGGYSELLLFGVTGSGKTEVYLKATEAALAAGRGVIVLVPEIALTRQLVEVFSSRIMGTAVLHSGMPDGQRYQEWERIKRGEARLVLGARSAVFAPMPDLGLIIIDEEQEGSFKQEEMPRYHARDVARQRARLEAAVVLEGSATPAIETFWAARNGKIKLLILQDRVGGGRMPTVTVSDMRKPDAQPLRGLIGSTLRDKIAMGLERGEQSILFINRRGYTPMTVCGQCGNIASCPACSVAMTYHHDIGKNICHYCNCHLPPEANCSRCGSRHMMQLGAGTQKIEEEIKLLFPEARVARLDMDSSRRRGGQKAILEAMKNHKTDILVGTQMVAKGLDFPAVSLVGIVDADSILNLPDFRAGERCFQLLVQAAGRAGRSSGSGEVVIQTYNPGHPVIQLAAAQDYPDFYEYEIKLRKMLNYPPFCSLLRIVMSSGCEDELRTTAQVVAGFIEDLTDASEEDLQILGPAPCPINKIRHRYRWQLLIKCGSPDLLRSIAGGILSKGAPKNVKMELDLNPQTTM